MSVERVQISISNTKKEMLEAYELLLAEVQAKSLKSPKKVLIASFSFLSHRYDPFFKI